MDYYDFFERDRLDQIKVGIVGDSLLDQYFQVSVTRISPEYPIPVIQSEHGNPHVVRPGGAANVALQMEQCNAKVTLWCMVDEGARKELEKHNFTLRAVDLPPGEMIPRKNRYYDNSFPVYRHDIESKIGNKQLRRKICDSFRSIVKSPTTRPDVVILSDYNKGVFNYTSQEEAYLGKRLITICRDYKVPVIVDPKSGPLEQWKGCSIFKPNSVEAVDFSNKSDWKDQLIYLHNSLIESKWRDTQVIITQGGRGVVGYDEKKYTSNPFWQYENKVFHNSESVIGAGDCFVAYLAVAIAHGYSIQDASEIAYNAGATYIQQRFNKPVSPKNLLGTLDSKILTTQEAIDEFKVRDYSLAMSNGCFDLIHSGHLKILNVAKSKADKLVVAIDTDESVRKLKGPNRPVKSLEERLNVVASLECVDFVVAFHTDELYNLIKAISPNVLAKGGDYKIEDIVGHDLVEHVIVVPLVEGKSTTELVERLRK